MERRETVDAYALATVGAVKGVYEEFIKEEVQRNPAILGCVAVGLALGIAAIYGYKSI